MGRWGSFANGEEGYEELDASVSYRIGLKTWANWVDSNIDPNKTRVFFTTMSPTHQRSLSLSLFICAHLCSMYACYSFFVHFHFLEQNERKGILYISDKVNANYR